MRKRNIQKHYFVNQKEADIIAVKAKKVRLSESALIRMLLLDFVPHEKPDDRFYVVIRDFHSIANNMNQLARKAAVLGFIDVPFYKMQAEKISKLCLDIRREFLLPHKTES